MLNAESIVEQAVEKTEFFFFLNMSTALKKKLYIRICDKLI